MTLTSREKQILQLKAKGLSDYKIARELKIHPPNVTRSRKTALIKMELAKEDFEFIKNLNK